jgi:adenylate cyclase class 2
MKFAVADFDAVRQHLAQWHAIARATIAEADHYFNAPDRDFAQTDEAFRLRCIGTTNRVTYKGPKQGGPTKTRTEIEIGLEPGPDIAEQFRRLVQCLGYRPTAVVTKRRTIHEFARDGFAMQACLDDVESLGRFVEIDIMAEPDQKQRAQAVLLQVVGELELPASEPRSYLEMVLAKTGG